MREPKILFFDIETSHSVVATFGLFPPSIPHDNILIEWQIICAAWKWLGDKKIHGVKMENGSDKNVVEALRAAIDEADVIVGHNSDKFDVKKLMTRVLFHGLQPIGPKLSVDTLKVAKKHFKFDSNRLDYIAKFLNVGGKMNTSKGLWLDALAGKQSAINEMLRYNKADVEITEKVYLKLRPFMDAHPSIPILSGIVEEACPTCGSSNVHKYGFKYTKAGKYQKYLCRDCGAVSADRSAVIMAKLR